ncbi:MAG: 1,6-anhydro-N-acetylmuramyl-L-alanine amidase AmpD [Steroidobacteraceae bacterium]
MHARLHIDTATGLLADTRQILCTHFDARPAGVAADLIVIHGISLPPGEFGGPYIEQLFSGDLDPSAHPYFAGIVAARVSAHVVIRRDGQLLQFVPFGARAWHAGTSSYQGRNACNDFSIGIELEGTGELAYCDAQYDQLALLIEALCSAYPTLSTARVTGHSDIAPGRKSDPGAAFDWERLRARLR